MVSPEAVGDDNDGRAASLIKLGAEDSSELRLHAEHRKIIGRYKLAEDALRLRGRIFGAFEMAEWESDAARREAWLTFAIVGAGLAQLLLVGSALMRQAVRPRRLSPRLSPEVRYFFSKAIPGVVDVQDF